jgi:hypothetical protein
MLGYSYSFTLAVLGGFDMAFLGGVLVFGIYIFIAYTSIKLFRFRKSALRLAWLLLALETVGGVLLLLLGAADYTNSYEFELAAALVFASIVLVAWTLPNALLFYRARKLFSEPGLKK